MSIEPFRSIVSRTLVLKEENIDTDQIVPARFLTTTGRDSLADACFHDWRFDPSGAELDHPLNSTDMQTHKILVAGNNFGCGSSREHAPWALLALGFRAVISSEIADIFRSNSLKNGLLPVVVAPEVLKTLQEQPGREISIDLEKQELRFGNHVETFSTEPFARRCLLNGQDSLDVLIEAIPEIEAFEGAQL